MTAPIFDLHRGKIVVWLRHWWQTGWFEVYLAPGYVTLAYHWKPNEHLGIWPEQYVLDGSWERRKPHRFGQSPYARIGKRLDGPAAALVNWVRIGRVATIFGDCAWLVDDLRAVWSDYDDLSVSLDEQVRRRVLPPSGRNIVPFPVERRAQAGD